MTVGTFFWHVVLPAERQNLISNPSFELGTAGWSGTVASAFGTASAGQAFGAWAGTVRGAGDFYGCWHAVSLGSGSAYTASAHVRIVGAAAGSVQLRIGGGTSNTGVGSAWTRITAGTTTAAAGNTYVQVLANSATGGTLWVDGVQVESGSVTTYVDGDQEGCSWLGAPHASQSYRGGQVRAGGSVIPLAALGLRAETSPGAGVAPPVNLAQGRAALDGAEYQRTRYDVRELVLTATLTGTATPDMHLTRRRVFDAIKASRTTPQQPVRLLYTGAGSTVALDAVYAGGLEMTETGVIDDKAAVRFSAFEPAWYGPYDQGTALAPYTVLGSVNYMAYRDPMGRWGTMGAAGVTLGNYTDDLVEVRAVLAVEGTVFMGGRWRTAGGTVSHLVAQYAGGAFGSLGGGILGTAGGTVNSVVNALYRSAAGTLYAGGLFAPIAGTSSQNMAQHVNGAWGTLTGGTLTTSAFAITGDPRTGGFVVAGGAFSAGGTAGARYVAQYQAGAWGSLVGGTVAAAARDLAFTADGGTLWAVGDWTSVAGTTARRAAFWNRSRWGTPAGETQGASLRAVALDPQQQVYAAGQNAAGDGHPRRYRPGGVGTLAGFDFADSSGAVVDLLAEPSGDLLVSGNYFALYGGNRLELPFSLARWNGFSWLPSDLILSQSQAVNALARSSDGTLYVGGAFYGVGTAASVAPVVNTGMSDAYPILRMRNTGAGTARIYQLLNATTGDDLYFNLIAAPGEYITLDLTPGNIRFESTTRGNLINTVIAGSNLATWRLQPGTNWVSFLADGAGIRADLYWRPRHESADGGAAATL